MMFQQVSLGWVVGGYNLQRLFVQLGCLSKGGRVLCWYTLSILMLNSMVTDVRHILLEHLESVKRTYPLCSLYFLCLLGL